MAEREHARDVGGGITIENAGFETPDLLRNRDSPATVDTTFGSTAFGSYLLGSSAIAINHPKVAARLQMAKVSRATYLPLPWSRERTEVRDCSTPQIQPLPYPIPLEGRGDTVAAPGHCEQFPAA
jgi:hypothetical protein